MKRNSQKTLAIWALVVALVATSVAYAALQTTLNISGSVTKKGGSWNIVAQNVHNIAHTGEGAFTATPTASGTSVTFAASLAKPNDTVSFDVDLVNKGTIDANLVYANVSMNEMSGSEMLTANSDDITCTTSFNDTTIVPESFNSLNLVASANPESAPTTKTVHVLCSYDNVSSISSNDVTLSIAFRFDYNQA